MIISENVWILLKFPKSRIRLKFLANQTGSGSKGDGLVDYCEGLNENNLHLDPDDDADRSHLDEELYLWRRCHLWGGRRSSWLHLSLTIVLLSHTQILPAACLRPFLTPCSVWLHQSDQYIWICSSIWTRSNFSCQLRAKTLKVVLRTLLASVSIGSLKGNRRPHLKLESVLKPKGRLGVCHLWIPPIRLQAAGSGRG